MGRTKALVEIDGVPMARRVAEVLTAAGCFSVVAIGGDPVELEPLGVPVLADRHPGSGPLDGVIGALEWFADEHVDGVVTVACDLPFLDVREVSRLVDALGRRPDVDVVVARTARIEPACAVWRPAAAAALQEMFDAGERALHRAIERVTSVEVDVDPTALGNINTPDDLDRYA
jgi:molybdopterin-guanine dinucleotide biosynthesis protein A